jgi:hypothetical protein
VTTSAASNVWQSATLVGASVAAATNTEISHATEAWIQVGDYGWVLPPYNAAPANSVAPISFRCTTAGTAIVKWNNPTAGALTPANASAASPYMFICHRGGQY